MDAGAEVVGGEELIKSIQAGIVNFDTAIATPEMMVHVGKIGRVRNILTSKWLLRCSFMAADKLLIAKTLLDLLCVIRICFLRW